jgi:ferredoxin--NADP+ reductase
MAAKVLNALLVQRAEVAPGLLIVRVVADGWPLPDFTPGQFAVLGLPGAALRVAESDAEETAPDPDKILSRAYSIASSSRAREYLEFYITLVRSGALTPRLFRLGLGDRLWLGPRVTGRFTLDEIPVDANLLMLATGTGVAPYMSMIRSILGRQRQRRVTVVHGARHSWDLGYGGELTTLAGVCANLDYVPIISQPGREPFPWGGHTGYVQDVWQGGLIDRLWGFHPTPADTHVLLCGNPLMVETMEGLLQGEGFAEHTPRRPGQYHLERYW